MGISSYYHLNISIMPIMSPSFGFLTFGTISPIYFHHLSTHATCVTCVHVIGDFCNLRFHFTAPDTRCLEKRANFDCLGIQRNSTCLDSNGEIRFVIRDLENKFWIFDRNYDFSLFPKIGIFSGLTPYVVPYAHQLSTLDLYLKGGPITG